MSRPIAFNPFLPEFRENPHPFYHRLRSEEPVHWSQLLGGWVLTSYTGVMAAFRDPRFSSRSTSTGHRIRVLARDAEGQLGPTAQIYRRWLLELDPPDHTRLRALVTHAFTPRIVEGMRAEIRSIIDERLDAVRQTGEMDVFADFAHPVPVRVIAALLGVPPDDEPVIRRCAEALLPMFSGFPSLQAAEESDRAVLEFTAYFRRLVRSRRSQPSTDLISGMIAAQQQDDRLSDEEIVIMCIFLALAGHATVVQLICNAVLVLHDRSDLRETLRARPDLVSAFVEEALRFDSPFQMASRTTVEAVELHGVTIPADAMVYAMMAAANRDPEQFPDPDHFDITRAGVRHVAFGYGLHFCVGAALGRLEGQLAVQAMLERLGEFDVRRDRVVRENSLVFRGIRTLPLTFQPW